MKYLKLVLKIGFAAGLIFWLVRSGRFDVSSLTVLFEPSFLIPGMIIVMVSFIILSERWRLLLRSQGFHVSFATALRLTLIGLFFNYAMPGGVGGDLIKGFYVVRSQPDKKLKSGLTVLMDRVFGLYVIVLMAAVSLLFDLTPIWANPRLRLIGIFIFAFATAYTVGLLIGFSQKLCDQFNQFLPKKLQGLWHALVTYSHDWKVLLFTLLLSLLGQFVFLLFYYLAGQKMGYLDVPFLNYAVACLIGIMVNAVPISPGGIGVGQAAFAFLFVALAGPSTEKLGAALASAAQIFTFIWSLLGAYFYLRLGDKKQLANEAKP